MTTRRLPCDIDRDARDQVATLRDALNEWLMTPVSADDFAASVADLRWLALAFARGGDRHCSEDLGEKLADELRTICPFHSGTGDADACCCEAP